MEFSSVKFIALYQNTAVGQEICENEKVTQIPTVVLFGKDRSDHGKLRTKILEFQNYLSSAKDEEDLYAEPVLRTVEPVKVVIDKRVEHAISAGEFKFDSDDSDDEMDIDAALEEACNHLQSQRRRIADNLLACFEYLESTF